MKREVLVHFSFWFAFFVFITLIKGWFSLSYWPFWVGGIVGTVLPDIDHFLYVLFLQPQELTSRRVSYMLGKREIWQAIRLLYDTRSERSNLIFHTITFQLIFAVLTFWVMTSSASLFGRGLVLAFSLHLLIDRYWFPMLLLVLVFGFLL